MVLWHGTPHRVRKLSGGPAATHLSLSSCTISAEFTLCTIHGALQSLGRPATRPTLQRVRKLSGGPAATHLSLSSCTISAEFTLCTIHGALQSLGRPATRPTFFKAPRLLCSSSPIAAFCAPISKACRALAKPLTSQHARSLDPPSLVRAPQPPERHHIALGTWRSARTGAVAPAAAPPNRTACAQPTALPCAGSPPHPERHVALHQAGAAGGVPAGGGHCTAGLRSNPARVQFCGAVLRFQGGGTRWAGSKAPHVGLPGLRCRYRTASTVLLYGHRMSGVTWNKGKDELSLPLPLPAAAHSCARC